MGFLRQRRRSDPVIDLREPAAKPPWGSPVPCPSCGGRGYIEQIELVHEVMYLHCLECYTKYTITRRELESDTSRV